MDLSDVITVGVRVYAFIYKPPFLLWGMEYLIIVILSAKTYTALNKCQTFFLVLYTYDKLI